MKRDLVSFLAAAVVMGLFLVGYASAAEAAKTITGKPSCGGCTGVVEKCSVMLTDKDGVRWILTGEDAVLKEAFEARHGDKAMTATLAGEPATKKGKDRREYREVKVSAVVIDK